MLNVVLWLSGISLCLTAIQDYRPVNWSWDRDYGQPWARTNINRMNNSKFLKRRHKSCPLVNHWSLRSNRRVSKPPFKFYPYYTNNPFKNLPYLNPRSNLYPFDLLESKKLFNRRNTFPLMGGKSKMKSVQVLNDQLNSEAYPEESLNDTCLKLSKNETMIISPTILIGHKNLTSPDDSWILSNKPINIYLKKVPNSNKVFKVLRGPEIVDLTTICTKTKGKKINTEEYDVIESDYTIKYEFGSTTNKVELQTSSNLDITSTSTERQSKINESNQLVNIIIDTTEYLNKHPVKKKIFNTPRPGVYQIHLDELTPDNENSKQVVSSKKYSPIKLHKNLRREIDVKTKLKNAKSNRFRRFNCFPILRRCSKRSCTEHNAKRRLITTTEFDDDYLSEPEYVNYYEYNIDDDIFPQNILDDYSLEKIIDAATGDIINSENLNDEQSALNVSVSNCEDELSTPSEDDFKRTFVKPVLKKVVYGLQNHRSFHPPRQFFQTLPPPLFEEDKEFDDENECQCTMKPSNEFLKVQPDEKYKSELIKHLTDELEQKMNVFANLTLINFKTSTSNTPCDHSTALVELSEPKTICSTLPSTLKMSSSSVKPILSISYEEELPLFDSVLISPNKVACERVNSRRCVCSPTGMINFFCDELQKESDAKILLKKIITYSCESYSPIKRNYEIAADMKPRLISKKRRELIESEFGPKAILPAVFDELMMRGIPREGVDFFVFPSTTVEIPCFTSDEMKLSPNLADSALYKWSHSNLKAITEGRILEDSNHKGSLIIQDVTLGDSDNYTCKVKYVDPDSQITVKRTFVHSVRVVVLPRLALHTNLHYSASSLCDQELLEMFELYLPQQIETLICSLGSSSGASLCAVEIHNPVCYTKNKQESMKRSLDPRLLWRTDYEKSRWIREILNEELQEMEISLNYELDLSRVSQFIPEASNWSTCSPHCHQKLSLKTIEILRDSFLDALLLPVRTKSVFFQPSLDSINIKMLTACDGGLELKDGFCAPCKKHHYSEQGKTVCLPCPPGTYQDDIGAKSCVPCPHPFRSNCFYLGNKRNLTLFVFVVITFLVSLCCIWLIIIVIMNKSFNLKNLKKIKKKSQTTRTKPLNKSVAGNKRLINVVTFANSISSVPENIHLHEKPEPLPPDFE